MEACIHQVSVQVVEDEVTGGQPLFRICLQMAGLSEINIGASWTMVFLLPSSPPLLYYIHSQVFIRK